MRLKVIIASGSSVNRKVINYAAEHLPSLIIDCANAANPHKYFPHISEEQFSQMYVIELEMLYKFRDVLLKVPQIAGAIKAKSIVVTTAHHLMNYQDKQENKDIYTHVWELLIKIGMTIDTTVAIAPGSIHEKIARQLLWGTRSAASEC